MKQLSLYLSITCVVLLTLSSCSNKAPKEAKYIPKNTSIVLSVDPLQMKEKLQKGGISIDSLLARVFNNDSLDVNDKARINEFISNAGMDWNGKLFIFGGQKTNADNSTSNTFSIMGSLLDAAKTESYLKKQTELKDKKIHKEKDYTYMVLNEGSMLAWNDQQIIATMYTHVQKPVYDTVAMTFKKPEKANTESEMKATVGSFFTQKISETLADVDIFTDMFKEKADGYIFSSANSSLAGLSMLPLQLPKLEELLKDNYVTATLSFEDGNIVAKSTSYTNQLLGSVLKQYAGPTVNPSILENFPSEHINAIVLASFNPEIFGGILKQLEVEGLANNFLEKSGFSSQDLYKSLKGEIAVIVSDFNMTMNNPESKMDEKHMLQKKPVVKLILNAPVGDKTAFKKIMDKGVEQGILQVQGGKYKSGGLVSLMGLYIVADDQNLIVANDSLTYVQFLAKSAKSNFPKDVLSYFKGKSTVGYFDIAGTLSGFSDTNGGEFQRSLLKAKETFKDVIVSSDNFDGKNIQSQLLVRLQNENQNSLVTLTSLLTDIAVDLRVQAKKEKEMEEKLFPGGIPAIIRTN